MAVRFRQPRMVQAVSIVPKFLEVPMYFSVRENDGTYTIRFSRHGCNSVIVLSGVRGCNVSRTINRLYLEDMGLA